MVRSGGVYGGVFVRGPNGKTVLVYDNTKPIPAWKFPGGGGKYLPSLNRWETPEETARRELEEETGLKASQLTLLIKIDKKDHLWHLFEARISDFNGILKRGNDGEFVSIFPESQILLMSNFLHPHKKVIKDLGIITPT